jgi:hypothetical protein
VSALFFFFFLLLVTSPLVFSAVLLASLAFLALAFGLVLQPLLYPMNTAEQAFII